MEGLIAILPIALAVVLVIIILLTGYIKASPDEALIISGLRKKPKILIGKAGIKVPFFEKKDKLNLQLIPIGVQTSSSVPTADYINIRVDAAVNVKISTDPDKLALAAQNFLNKQPDYIAKVAKEVLEGNMREIVGQMRLEEMVSDRQKFGDKVKENAGPDLARMGLDIVAFNVQNFIDENKVIENLGVDNVVRISKNAAISRANSEKEIAVAQAMAAQEANDAKVAADTAIAEKQNELLIKQAELKKESDAKKAEADAAYEIQKEEQRKTIEATKVNADIAQQERTVELKKKEADVAEETLNAEIKKKADADKYRRQQEAEAELIEIQKKADAEKYQQEKEAEIKKVKAQAEMEAKKKEAEAILALKQAEAEGIAAVGKAEAEAIAAKGLAEAEAMEKKANAYAKYNNAAVTEMIIKQLPEIAKAIAEPISAIDKVSIIDSGNGESGVAQVGGYTPAVLAKTMQAIKEATGFDLMETMKANTYDAKVNKNINVTGLENVGSSADKSDEIAAKVSKEVKKEVKKEVENAVNELMTE